MKNLNIVNIKNIINLGIGVAGTLFTYLLGEMDKSLEVLLIFICIDYVTGVLCAWIKGTVSSQKGKEGIVKKVGCLMIISAAYGIDQLWLGNTGAFRTAVIYFYISNEGISIVENWANMGLPIPAFVKNKLAQVRENLLNKTEIDAKSLRVKVDDTNDNI